MSEYYRKTPLNYQITEYDCATTTIMNAIRYLFDRAEIPPNVIKYIVQETLDNDFNGEIGKGGTSTDAMIKTCDWLMSYKQDGLDMNVTLLKGDDYSIDNPKLIDSINSGGVAIIRVFQDSEHYVLLTKIDGEYAYFFDPYYFDIKYYDNDNEVEIIKNKPFEYNRKVSLKRLQSESQKDFSLVRRDECTIIIMEKNK